MCSLNRKVIRKASEGHNIQNRSSGTVLTQPESHQKCFQFRTEYGRAFSFTLWKGLDEKPFWYVAILNCMHMASLDSVKSSGDMGTKVYAMHFTGL